MTEQLEKKAMRRRFNAIGCALLIYMVIMNVAVSLVSTVDVVWQVCMAMVNSGEAALNDAFIDNLVDSMLGNGWGYILAIAIGFLILRLWKGREFCYHEIWTKGRPMGVGDFFAVLSFVISCQMAFQILATVQETVLNWFGLSALASLEAASGLGDTFSMFLYTCIFGPIAEELLFRGLVLRSLQPYGKRFAIVTSAFLFGIFHGNLVQTPYAFLVGLVLGYVAVEHSIAWAMVLHMFNNLILADVMTRLTGGLPQELADMIFGIVILGFSVAAVIVAIVRRKEIAAYVRENRVDNRCVRGFFTAPGILVLTVLMWLTIAVTMAVQLL